MYSVGPAHTILQYRSYGMSSNKNVSLVVFLESVFDLADVSRL